MSKTRKKIIIVCGIVIVLVVAFGLFMINRYKVEKGIAMADKIDLSGQDFYHVKDGYYCGEGGCTEEHYIGYIYFSDKLTEEQAMGRADYHDLGNTFKDSDGTTYKEYNDGILSTIVECVVDYKDGHLLKYHVVGAG